MAGTKAAETRTEALSTLFIAPGSRIDAQHPDVTHFAKASKDDLRRRWKSEAGCKIIKKLQDARFEREVIESSVGRLYENYDLRGISLEGMDLSSSDLNGLDFFCADLRNVKFVGCNLTNTHFSEANIKGADFSFAQMNDAFLDNAVYDLKTTFTGVDTRQINFNLAALLQDQARNQQRIAHLKSRHPFLAFLLRYSCNYGQSLGLWAVWVLGVILSFAGVYATVPGLIEVSSLLDALYFSVVTFTTLGYGDITPVSPIGKLLVIFEVVLGYLMGGLLIAILMRRIIGD